VHAVVDFRGAPAPQQLIADMIARLSGGQGGAGLPGQTTAPTSSATPSSSSTPPQGIPNAMKPGPGGNVVYYRVD